METRKKLSALAVAAVLLMASCEMYSTGLGGITYTVTVSQPEHGTVSASPSSGAAGTTVTLDNTPSNTDYKFSHYTVNNVKIDGNTFNLNGDVTVSGEFTFPFTTPEIYREMVSMKGGNITGNDGVFITGRTVDIKPFNIARYETTYELYKEVYDWAVKNGYSFAYEGKEGYPYPGAGSNEGGKGTDDGAAWIPEQKKTRPVTDVIWRDAIVWCNAYSQMSGKTPVYYTDTTYTTVLKTSTNEAGIDTDADKAVVRADANGYRLPTEAEWEYAARGGDPSAAAWSEKYPGTNEDAKMMHYAWYSDNSKDLSSTNKDYGAHPVGTKLPNSAGLFDMSGNVSEWCWDWYGDITTTTPAAGAPPDTLGRTVRGGNWESPYGPGQTASRVRARDSPNALRRNFGFRAVRPQ